MSGMYAYIHNLQGDIVAIVDSNGTAVVQYKYDAWGRPISKTGSLAGTLGTVQPFRYQGYVYDGETGLYYLRSRYYNPTWYRFSNADSDLFCKGNKFICHQYAYCSNNPIMLVDSDGHEEVAFDEEDGNITNDKVGKPLSSANPLASGSGNSHPGRSGGTAHKCWVKQVIEVLKVMYPGAKIKTEAKVVAANGQIRYGDAGVYFPGSNSPYLVAQVGKSLMSGNPIARERRAITDITSSGVYVLYFAYDKNGTAMFYHP